MSPEKQRIAIAEACGWEATEAINPISGETVILWFQKGNRVIGNDGLFDYLNDLNAMHEVEKILSICLPPSPHTESEKTRYVNQLVKIAGTKGAFIATAAQRAEAFLKTIEKWEE